MAPMTLTILCTFLALSKTITILLQTLTLLTVASFCDDCCAFDCLN